jgi:hypothetical protein
MADVSGTISPADAKKAWTEAAARMAECQKAVETLRAVYALSPEEEEMLQKWNISGLRMSQGQQENPATTQSALAPTTQGTPTTKPSK